MPNEQLARQYFREEIAPSAYSFLEDEPAVLKKLEDGYVKDALANPKAVQQLRELYFG